MSILEKYEIAIRDFARLNEEELRQGMVGWMHSDDYSISSPKIQNLLCDIYEFLFPPAKSLRYKFITLPKEERQVMANYIVKIKKENGLL